MPNISFIDAHCHLFNKNELTFGGKLLSTLLDTITLIDNGNYQDANDLLQRVNAFMDVALKPVDEIASILFDQYGKDSAIVPLIYDMYFLSDNIQTDIQKHLTFLHKRVNEAPDRSPIPSEVLTGVNQLVQKITPSWVDSLIRDNCFEQQVQDMIQLKSKFGDRIYPFISFDPRRGGNLDAIKKYVGPGKPFQGVKLYAPLGYSAAHPSMMESNGLYDYCQSNAIPIVAHCSNGGMPTLCDCVRVKKGSWVIGGPNGQPLDSVNPSPDAIQLQKTTDVDFSHMKNKTQLKSQYFNHPRIWEKVLAAFPNLRLDLAHFGGDGDDWRQIIAGMLTAQHPNLYADVSCTSDAKHLKQMWDQYQGSAWIQSRLMYGSDFSILLMFSNLPDFCRGVAAQFNRNNSGFYCDNAKRFLGIS
jgi:predicted TIM-barrel fold metal-dependent hydrolase